MMITSVYMFLSSNHKHKIKKYHILVSFGWNRSCIEDWDWMKMKDFRSFLSVDTTIKRQIKLKSEKKNIKLSIISDI